MTAPRIVFCDFDGSITVNETFVGIVEQWVPEVWAEIKADLYALKLPLRDGVKRLIGSIPSHLHPRLLAYIRSQPLRPGWEEFLEFLNRHHIPLVVVSSGIRDMVETALHPWRSRILAIHAVDLDTQGEFLRAFSEFEGGSELVAKVNVMERYPALETVAIGDSITDLQLALRADRVFARAPLSSYLDERGVAYTPWDDFHGIRQTLQQVWGLS